MDPLKKESQIKKANSTSITKRLSRSKKLAIYRDLSTLIQAGMSIANSLEIIGQEPANSDAQKIIKELQEGVKLGEPFSEIASSLDSFNEHEITVLRIGEESGRFASSLQNLIQHHSHKIQLKQKLIKIISYPALVLLTSFFVVLFMFSFVVPMFEDAISRVSGEVPPITKLIIAISSILQQYGILALISFLICFGLFMLFRKQLMTSHIVHQGINKIPILSGVLRMVYISRFCNSMSVMLGAGITLDKAIPMAFKSTKSPIMEQFNRRILHDIKMGLALHEAFEKHDCFPSRMISLIMVGEQSNQLETQFDQLRDYYDNEMENSLTIFSTMLEPILLLILGFLVGIILIAMYLPLFQMTQGFEQF